MLATVGAAEALLAWAPTPLASSRAAQMPRPVLMALEKPLDTLDKQVISRAVRLSNHGAALTSLAYFGLVSSTMQMPNAQMPMATLASVITRRVGSTTNAQFSQFFATSITPASYVFFIWPCIAAVQTITLVISYLRPAIENGGPQNSLEALNSVAKGESLSQTEVSASRFKPPGPPPRRIHPNRHAATPCLSSHRSRSQMPLRLRGSLPPPTRCPARCRWQACLCYLSCPCWRAIHSARRRHPRQSIVPCFRSSVRSQRSPPALPSPLSSSVLRHTNLHA